MTPEDEEDNYLDEIKREDGLERFWLFYNGQWAESIAGLIAAIGGILWCFIYILGYSKSILGYVLAGIAIIGFVCCGSSSSQSKKVKSQGGVNPSTP